ncbi:MAG TPA: hypothetical protein VIR78_10365, partial [Malonomonas sp.]
FYLKKEREKHLGYTLVGPHRDDIIFYINNKQADKYSSQGQKRSLIISFKSAQVQEFKNIHGYSPILILDDMNSELDSHRKNQLLDNMLKGSGQVFITSTEFNKKYLVEDNKIYNVKKGVVSLSE